MGSSPAAQSPPRAVPAEPKHPDHHYVQDTAAPVLITGGGGGNVEVDDGTDSESSYASGPSTATTSVASSVFSFVYENGRRYQSDRFKSTGYFMPNDEGEQDRLDLYHHIFLLLLGGRLHSAPLENPQKVLDVGTGTGIWAIDFADLHPQAAVIGTDISPIQPSWVPPNITFEIDDMENDWIYPDESFDFIHMRSLSGSFQNWDKILSQAYSKMAPGGYLEFQDYGCEIFLSDGTKLDGINPDHAISDYIFHVTSAAERAKRPLRVGRGVADRMRKAGFVDVEEKTAIWPLGTWPKQKALKEVGRWGMVGMVEGAYPFGLYLLTREGWTPEEVRKLVDDALASTKKHNYYFQAWFVYGKKPEP